MDVSAGSPDNKQKVGDRIDSVLSKFLIRKQLGSFLQDFIFDLSKRNYTSIFENQ